MVLNMLPWCPVLLCLATGSLSLATRPPLTCLQCSNCQTLASPSSLSHFAYCREPSGPDVEPFCVNKTTSDGRVYRGCGKPYMDALYQDGCQAQTNGQTSKTEVVCRCGWSDCNGPDVRAADGPEAGRREPEVAVDYGKGARQSVDDRDNSTSPGSLLSDDVSDTRALWLRVHNLSTHLSILLVPVVILVFALALCWLAACCSLNRRLLKAFDRDVTAEV